MCVYVMYCLCFLAGFNSGGIVLNSNTALLEEIVESLGGDNDFIGNTIPLSTEDEMLVGRFVQQYCWADFNARRAVNYLRQINSGDSCEFSGKLNDKEVLEHLAFEAASLQGLPAVKKGLVASAKTLEMHRDLRHHFAHWAGRRAKHHNAFVLLTTSSSQAKKKGITALEVGMLGFVVFSIDDIEREIKNLISHNEYLAQAVNFLGNYAKNPESVA